MRWQIHIDLFSSSVNIERDTVNDTFGSSGPSTEEDWESSLNVGVIRITDEEMSRMPIETAHLYGSVEGYADILEVFHQLHCLVSDPWIMHYFTQNSELYANQTAEESTPVSVPE